MTRYLLLSLPIFAFGCGGAPETVVASFPLDASQDGDPADGFFVVTSEASDDATCADCVSVGEAEVPEAPYTCFPGYQACPTIGSPIVVCCGAGLHCVPTDANVEGVECVDNDAGNDVSMDAGVKDASHDSGCHHHEEW